MDEMPDEFLLASELVIPDATLWLGLGSEDPIPEDPEDPTPEDP